MQKEIFNQYAIGLLDSSKEDNDVEKINDQIHLMIEFLDQSNDDYLTIFESPKLTKEEKYDLVDSTFKAFDKKIINFLKIIIKNNRTHNTLDIFKNALLKFNNELCISEGIIYTTEKYNDSEIKKISNAIEKKIGKKVHLKNEIDESLIGGFKVVLEDDIFDASVLKKISSLKDNLLGGE